MKIPIQKLLLCIVAVMIIYSCTKESSTIDSLVQTEELAPLIAYSEGVPIENNYIVVFKEGTFPTLNTESINRGNYAAQKANFEAQAKLLLKTNGLITKEVKQSFVKTIQGVALELNEEELEEVRSNPDVDYVEQDQEVTLFMGGPPGGGGGGGNPQTTPWGITRVGGAADGTGLTAWIIDSGIDLDHPDLNVDAGLSASFGGGGGGADDANGHGTHVAGTVAALDNEIGVVGVAAGATVVAVRVVDRRGRGATSQCIAGVDYVAGVASAGDAANMSLGYPTSTALDNAVISAASGGIKFAIAAGNESQNTNNVSPGRANHNNIYTVSAMSQGDNWASFSNFANPPVDYCAPGVSVYSCFKNGGYTTYSGTSMASPHVCGILLLGNISSSGTVNGDPDGDADPIAHR